MIFSSDRRFKVLKSIFFDCGIFKISSLWKDINGCYCKICVIRALHEGISFQYQRWVNIVALTLRQVSTTSSLLILLSVQLFHYLCMFVIDIFGLLTLPQKMDFFYKTKHLKPVRTILSSGSPVDPANVSA